MASQANGKIERAQWPLKFTVTNFTDRHLIFGHVGFPAQSAFSCFFEKARLSGGEPANPEDAYPESRLPECLDKTSPAAQIVFHTSKFQNPQTLGCPATKGTLALVLVFGGFPPNFVTNVEQLSRSVTPEKKGTLLKRPLLGQPPNK